MSLENTGVQAATFRFPAITKKQAGPANLLKNRPYVTIVKQGLESAGKKKVLIPVGIASGDENSAELTPASDLSQLKYSQAPHKINHILLALDNSGSMNQGVTKDSQKSKLAYIKDTVQRLVDLGLPEDTKITLVTFNRVARIKNDVNGYPYEFRTDLKTLIETIDSVQTESGTNIFEAIDFSHKKIHEYDPKEKERNFFILITDGEDFSGKDSGDFYAVSKRMLYSNTTSYLIGVGGDYKQDFLFTRASNIGPGVVGHTSLKTNPFTQYMPTILDDLQTSDHYLHISAVGLKDSDKYFPITPGIRMTPFSPSRRVFEDFGGYQQNLASVSFAQASNTKDIKYFLELRMFAKELSAKPHAIPIYDIGSIPPELFELGKEAEERFIWSLAALAQINKDIDALIQIHEKNPNLVSQKQIKATEAFIANPDDPDTKQALFEATTEASTSIEKKPIKLPGLVPVNPFSAIPEEIIPPPNPSPVGNEDNVPEPHSGGLGPIDPNEKSIDIPPMEVNQIDPAVYDNVTPVKKIVLELPGGSKKIELSLKDNETITLGRGNTIGNHFQIPSCPGTVSRKHFSIRRERDDFYIQDENSSAGTILNGVRISGEQRLELNSLIKVGPLRIRVKF